MKLIDLLVQELPKRGGWPVGAAICERYRHEGNIDFYDEKGNWSEDCGKKYGFGFAKELIQPREPGVIPNIELVTRDQYESSLAASKQPAQDGAGLPQVGAECEVTAEYFPEWRKIKVVYVHKGEVGAIISDLNHPLNNTLEKFSAGYNGARFRPIPTEADRRREEVADSLNKLLGDIEKYPTWRDALSGIYALVAAGKVAHLKIEASDE